MYFKVLCEDNRHSHLSFAVFIATGLALNLIPVLVASTSAYVLSLITLAPIILLRVLVVNRK